MMPEHEKNKFKIIKYFSQDNYINPSILKEDSAFPNQGYAQSTLLSTYRFSQAQLSNNIPYMSIFFSQVSNVCKKFKFNIKNNECWKYYVYPSESRIHSYICDMMNQGQPSGLRFEPEEEVIKREIGNVININHESTVRWINSTLQSMTKSSQRSLNIIKGGSGSGKSSLIKMILTKHRDIFDENDFIPTRVDYTRVKYDIKNHMQTSNNKDYIYKRSNYKNNQIHPLPETHISTIINTVNMCISRDSFIYLIKREIFGKDSKSQNIAITQDPKSIQFLRKSVKSMIDSGFQNPHFDEYIYDEMIELFYEEIDKLIGYLVNGDDKIFFKINEKLKKFIVSMASSLGKKFIVILDGFDVITMDEMLFGTSQLELLVSIGSVIGDTKSFDYASDFSCAMEVHFIAAIRSNTLAFLLQNISSDHQKVSIQHIWTVLPPSVGELISARIDWLIDTLDSLNIHTTTSREKLKSLSFEICQCIVNELNMKNWNLIQISNFDCRKTLEFVSDVVLFISDRVKVRRGVSIQNKISVDEFVSIIESEAKSIIKEQSYILVELLLLRNNLSFSNRIAEKPDSDSHIFFVNGRKFRDQDQMSGIVDNMYNYIAYKSCRDSNRSSINLKIRVSQILDAHGTLTRESISKYLKLYFGYSMSKEDMTVLLLTMVRTGLLFCDWDANTVGRNGDERIRYGVNNIAIFLISGIIFTQAYIEHVFHKTRLPYPLCENSIPCMKYHDMQFWPVASMVNAFIFYNTVRAVELIEEASGRRAQRDAALGDWQIAPKIKKQLIGSAERILSNPLSYIGKKDGSGKVLRLMEKAIDGWSHANEF